MSDNFNNYSDNNSTDNNGGYESYPQGNLNSYSYTPSDSSPKKPKKHIGLKIAALVLGAGIVAGGSIQVYKIIDENSPKISDYNGDESSKDDNSDSSSSSEESMKETSSSKSKDDEELPSLIDLASREDAMAVPDIVDTVMPSVVGISATFEYTASSGYGSDFGFGFGFGYGGGSGYDSQTQQMVGTGTGIVMTEDGYVITNAHCIYDESEYNCGKAVEVSVLFSEESGIEPSEVEAKIIAYDTETDLAVLKVDQTGLTPATFGDSSELRRGELVIAIGNPLGFDLFGSVTSGIVSALDRQISINDKNMNLIQTDAAINSGNSGGPLVNSCGQVIGINSAKMSSSYYSSASIEGLGFAIPINEAKIIIDDLINYKYVTGRPQIGISTRDVTETVSKYYNIPMGVYVAEVQEGSTAEFAGIQVGDVIIGIAGEPITTAEELNEIKNRYKAGDEITLTITRNGEDIEISLVLQEQKAQDDSSSVPEDSRSENER